MNMLGLLTWQSMSPDQMLSLCLPCLYAYLVVVFSLIYPVLRIFFRCTCNRHTGQTMPVQLWHTPLEVHTTLAHLCNGDHSFCEVSSPAPQPPRGASEYDEGSMGSRALPLRSLPLPGPLPCPPSLESSLLLLVCGPGAAELSVLRGGAARVAEDGVLSI
jgi:hypothetical protein